MGEVVRSVSESTDEEQICAICFIEQASFVALPCKCKINYCDKCWDRALATSFARIGHPQCPSCRSAFSAEFDAKVGRLVFTPTTAEAASSGWRSRLYGKAKPVQIQLLHNFGAACGCCPAEEGQHCECSGDGVSDFAAAAAAAILQEHESDEEYLGGSPHPTCACGAHLELVSARRRIEIMLDDKDQDWRRRHPDAERFMEHLLHSGVVICDLCSEPATRTGAVWTCTNGARTVLHPTAYDVCQPCFRKYAGIEARGAGGEPTAARGDVQGCHMPFMAAARQALTTRFRALRLPGALTIHGHNRRLARVSDDSDR